MTALEQKRIQQETQTLPSVPAEPYKGATQTPLRENTAGARFGITRCGGAITITFPSMSSPPSWLSRPCVSEADKKKAKELFSDYAKGWELKEAHDGLLVEQRLNEAKAAGDRAAAIDLTVRLTQCDYREYTKGEELLRNFEVETRNLAAGILTKIAEVIEKHVNDLGVEAEARLAKYELPLKQERYREPDTYFLHADMPISSLQISAACCRHLIEQFKDGRSIQDPRPILRWALEEEGFEGLPLSV